MSSERRISPAAPRERDARIASVSRPGFGSSSENKKCGVPHGFSAKVTWQVSPPGYRAGAMKLPSLVLISCVLLCLVGCGRKETSAAATPPPPAPSAGPKTFELTAGDAMKFNLSRMEVTAGETVKVILTNTGTLPRDVMGHNWVLLKKDASGQAFANAAMTCKEQDYLPPQLADQVIAHTRLVGPRQTDEVVFKAPAEPGEYPFLCSFPAHYASGMKGVLVIR